MKKRRVKLLTDFIWGKLLPWIVLAGLSVYVILPLLNMIVASVKPLSEIQVSSGGLLPSRFDFGTYVRMWETVPLLHYIINSLIIVSISTAVSIFISVFA